MIDIESHAFAFLRLHKRCPVVLHERSPREGIGNPDTLGVTQSRYLLEIEIKRTVSDFRANAQKHHVAGRDRLLRLWPRQFWFMVLPSIADRVRAELPPYAGLLVPANTQEWATEIVPAPVNRESRRLGIKSCLRLVTCQSNQLLSEIRMRNHVLNRGHALRYDEPDFSI